MNAEIAINTSGVRSHIRAFSGSPRHILDRNRPIVDGFESPLASGVRLPAGDSPPRRPRRGWTIWPRTMRAPAATKAGGRHQHLILGRQSGRCRKSTADEPTLAGSLIVSGAAGCEVRRGEGSVEDFGSDCTILNRIFASQPRVASRGAASGFDCVAVPGACPV